MEHSNKFLQIIFRIFPFADFLHILQLENYETKRYLSRLKYLFLKRDLQRLEQLKWTTRAKLTAILAALLVFLGIFLIYPFYVFYVTLIIYFVFNKNGPNWFWTTILLWSAIFNLFLIVFNLGFDTPILQTIGVYLSWGYVILLFLGLLLSGFYGKSSLPKKGRFGWFLFLVLATAFSFLRLSGILATLQIVILLFALSVILIPVWIGLANILLTPVFFVVKKNLYQKAQRYLQTTSKNLKVITVVGSYGKTTTKNFIYQLLKYSYKVQMIPGNINTATGIANWILTKFESSTEILLLEADGYDAGEYVSTATIVQPDFVVITNVGDQHLERFGTMKNLAKAILQFPKNSKAEATVVVSSMTVEDYACWEIDLAKELAPRKIIQVDLTQKPTYKGQKLSTTDLSSSNKTNLLFALTLAEQFDIPLDFVQDTVSKLELPERRQDQIELFGFETLDDSYNISYTTAIAGLERAAKLAKKAKKDLVVIFAGIPELGSENLLANYEIAKQMAPKARHIILLETILTGATKTTLQKLNFQNIYTAGSMIEAWQIIKKKFDPQKHYILMQPELNDLYYEG